MEYKHYDNEIVGVSDGEVVANVTFPTEEDGVVNIEHTFVKDEFRGKSIARELMIELVKNLEETKRVAILTCPYAVEWFSQNPQYSKFVKK